MDAQSGNPISLNDLDAFIVALTLLQEYAIVPSTPSVSFTVLSFAGKKTVKMFKNMPWSHEGADKEAQEKDEQSLMSILDEGDREEFTLLIASITAVMRQTIESNFDATVRLP